MLKGTKRAPPTFAPARLVAIVTLWQLIALSTPQSVSFPALGAAEQAHSSGSTGAICVGIVSSSPGARWADTVRTGLVWIVCCARCCRARANTQLGRAGGIAQKLFCCSSLRFLRLFTRCGPTAMSGPLLWCAGASEPSTPLDRGMQPGVLQNLAQQLC